MSIESTMLGVTLRITGDAEIVNTLKTLRRSAQMKILRPAFRAGARVVARDAKRRVPKRTGYLKKAIKPISARMDASALVVMNKRIANPNEMRAVKGLTQRRPYRPAYIARIVERGSAKRNIAAQPFLEPALESKREAALNKIAAEIRKRF